MQEQGSSYSYWAISVRLDLCEYCSAWNSFMPIHIIAVWYWSGACYYTVHVYLYVWYVLQIAEKESTEQLLREQLDYSTTERNQLYSEYIMDAISRISRRIANKLGAHTVDHCVLSVAKAPPYTWVLQELECTQFRPSQGGTLPFSQIVLTSSDWQKFTGYVLILQLLCVMNFHQKNIIAFRSKVLFDYSVNFWSVFFFWE